MGIFLQPEWGNFVRAERGRPWRWPRYAMGLALLVYRRFANALRLKVRGSNHRGLKEWPRWLGARNVGNRPRGEGSLSFPRYPGALGNGAAEAVPELHLEAGDPEAYFATHRWGHCFRAALAGEMAARASLREARAWMQRPPGKNDAAWEPYSSCERVVNLAVMLAVHPGCLDAGEVDKEIVAFLDESVQWINSRLEFYGIERTNNHILNNARALVVGGSVLGDAAVVERGLVLFARMARELFLPGGFLRERSSHYQVVVANWLMDVLHFAPLLPLSRPSALAALAQLHALSGEVCSATALLLDAGDGLDTHIGDISPDNHPAAARMRLLCLYPGRFQRVGRLPDGQCDDWLFVSDGRNSMLACGMPPACPIDYTTHGHADLGSFIWARGKQAVLVDAGRGSYVDGPATRRQCGPAGHNTLTIQGLAPVADSLLKNGRWCPRPYAKAAVSVKQTSGTGFSLTHNGFSRIPGLGVHSRSVMIDGDGVSVMDSVEGVGVVDIDIYWHFAPGFLPHGQSECVSADKSLTIHVQEDGRDLSASACSWEEYPYAAAYGDVQSAFMVHSKSRVSLPWRVKTTFKVTPCAA